MSTSFHLRPYRTEDEDAAIALWQRSWQQAYPGIDFAERLAWWRGRWRNELVPNATVIVAEQDGASALPLMVRAALVPVARLTGPGVEALRLEVECLECELADLGPTWDAKARPMHEVDQA